MIIQNPDATATMIEPNDYDKILLAFSGGKDSLACLLHLIEIGTDMSKVELWHHNIDGMEGSSLMDWPVTHDYCHKVAEAFNLPIYFSWRIDGIEGEIRKDNDKTKPVRFEGPVIENAVECGIETFQAGGKRSKLGTRLMWPAKSPDLARRWCSAVAKIDVMSLAINNQPRFLDKKTLVITGERAEESKNRAKYKVFEQHRCHSEKRVKRHVDHWRPVHTWSESQVWDIIKRHKVNPHPAYKLGWGRLSCAACIFGSKNQWASLRQINPAQFGAIASLEQEIDHTIEKGNTISEIADKGNPYGNMNPLDIAQALSKEYAQPVLIDIWALPTGAFGENNGPS